MLQTGFVKICRRSYQDQRYKAQVPALEWHNTGKLVMVVYFKMLPTWFFIPRCEYCCGTVLYIQSASVS